MFANSLLKQKLVLSQQFQDNQNDCSQNDQPGKNEGDFTFNNYISQQQIKRLKIAGSTEAVGNNLMEKVDRTPKNQADTKQSQQQRQSSVFELEKLEYQEQSEQLSVLKQHLMNIQGIAMKQIQGLKAKLNQSQTYNFELLEQVKQVKNALKQLQSGLDAPLYLEGDKLRLLQEQNRMLKEALKKQLLINKRLIKDSISKGTLPKTPSIQVLENKLQPIIMQANQNFEGNQQNNNFSSNRIRQKQIEKSALFQQYLKPNLYDKPSIPLPSHSKKPSIRN